MRRKLNTLTSRFVAAALFSALLLAPAMTSGQKRKGGGGGSSGGNCAACSQRAVRACEGSENPRTCWEQEFNQQCVAGFGCSMPSNPF